jgi:hypothetical protein
MGLASDTEGDYENFLMAMGIDADMIDAIDAVGGPPSLGDMRDAIERSTFEELVEAREAMRAGFREYVARLPSSPILTFVLSRFDEPRTECELACALASGLATGHRGEQADAQDLGHSSAVALVAG